MAPRRSVKAQRSGHSFVMDEGLQGHGCIVGVIASMADLNHAIRLRRPPDLFELRLDCLVKILDVIESKLSILGAPLIITARDPREGGASQLSIEKRGELLLRFLPRATYVDVELRSIEHLQTVVDQARDRNIRIIISVHDFHSTPDLRSLCAMARRAKALGADIFKVASRTDTLEQVNRLLDFIEDKSVDLPLSLLGIGKLGVKARRQLMGKGSVLNYAGMDRTTMAGQPILCEIRRWTSRVRHSTFYV